ncbi:MAG: xylulokinase [Armatimonadota bacterium]|nr:MAG: xylulokinase [Armatimonadota bacterium]
MSHFLGIDIGTGGARCLVIDGEGRVKGSATAEYPLSTPRPLWAEQQPEDWWQAVVRAVPEALGKAGVSGTDVGAIGLSGQMHGAVFLDTAGQVIRPAILWCDQRTAAECEEITARAGADTVARITLNPVLTGFQAPKIVWLKNNEPDAFAKIRKVLLPKDYIRFRMTGAFATEVSDASGTSLLNVRERRWSPEMMAASFVEPEWLPECFESVEPSAAVSAEAAERLGLRPGTPVVGGGGDQAAGGVGSGIVEPGLVSSSLGTSGVVFAYADEPFVDPQMRTHTFCHAVPGKWHVMGVVLSAGGSLRWYRDTFCQDIKTLAAEKGVDPYDLMTAEAAEIPAGCDGLFFLPYLSGERTPYPDPYARGVFFGATLAHTRAHFTRAVLEGVGFALKDSFDILRSIGVDATQVRVMGGGARSSVWRRILTDIVGRAHVTLNVDEGPAFGVALLAGVSQGAWSSVQEACRATLTTVERDEPRPGAVERYAPLHAFYSSLYAALRERFAGLARLADE